MRRARSRTTDHDAVVSHRIRSLSGVISPATDTSPERLRAKLNGGRSSPASTRTAAAVR